MSNEIDWWSSTSTGAPMLVWTSPRGVPIYRRDVYVIDRARVGQPPSHLFVVALAGPCTDAPVTFTHEGAGDRFLEAIGIAGRVKTGDAAFDAAVAIDTEASAETVHSLLASASSRAELHGLLVMTGGLRIEGSTITVAVGNWQAADPAREAALFSALLRFAESLGDEGAQPFRQSAPRRVHIVPAQRKALPRVAFTLAVVLGIGAGAAFLLTGELTPPMFSNDLATMGRWAGAGAWFVCSVLALLALRGRSQSPREIALAWAALLGLIPFGGAAAELANAALPPHGAAIRHDAFLDSWPLRKGGRSLTVTTPKGDLPVPQRIVVGLVPYDVRHMPVIVESRVGALGAESITRVIAVPARP